jgi:hypothetical protein
MTEKYFRLNDAIFIFHPDTHEVLRIDRQCVERCEQPEAMRSLRLRAREITRQQAAAALGAMHCRLP